MATWMSVRYRRNWPAGEQKTRLKMKPKEQMKKDRISRDFKYLLRFVQKLDGADHKIKLEELCREANSEEYGEESNEKQLREGHIRQHVDVDDEDCINVVS